MKKWREGVWQCSPGLVHIRACHISFVANDATAATKRRSRICVHQPEDSLHQMLIAFAPGSTNDMHSHERDESVYVISGKLEVAFEDRESITLGAGDFLRIPGGLRHRPTPLGACIILETILK